jgi:hypothetical protein
MRFQGSFLLLSRQILEAWMEVVSIALDVIQAKGRCQAQVGLDGNYSYTT